MRVCDKSWRHWTACADCDVMTVNSCRCPSPHTLRRTWTGTSSSEWIAKQLTCEWTSRLRATLCPASSHVRTALQATNCWCRQQSTMTSTLAGYDSLSVIMLDVLTVMSTCQLRYISKVLSPSRGPVANRAALISVSIALSQTPAEAASSRARG